MVTLVAREIHSSRAAPVPQDVGIQKVADSTEKIWCIKNSQYIGEGLPPAFYSGNMWKLQGGYPDMAWNNNE